MMPRRETAAARAEQVHLATGGQGGAGPATARARVLVVDDEEDVREALEMVLSSRYEVTAVASGEAAVAAASRERFDLAITDLRMPGMGGAATITALKSLQPALVVIVASGYASDDVVEDCLRRGALATIRKPFDLDEFLETIGEALT